MLSDQEALDTIKRMVADLKNKPVVTYKATLWCKSNGYSGGILEWTDNNKNGFRGATFIRPWW